MTYKSLRECVVDLERANHLVRVTEEVDPHLEMAEIQRRVFEAEGPALLFENVKGTRFDCASNLFGTMERCRFLFRSTLERVGKIVQLKADPAEFWRRPLTFASSPLTAFASLPLRVKDGPALACRASIAELPAIQSWPDDGGAFITLPQVYTEDPSAPRLLTSNLGMYRVQLSGGQYEPNREIGLHYQIHRGIGVHHARARERGEPLRVSIFVGGPPAHTFAAVMPLPEGLSELLFAGMLGGRKFRYARRDGFVISTDADFCITGTVDPTRTLPEGPFGDHLGYYSLRHDFPVLEVRDVHHRRDAIWPFTVVGRPPQEDTSFGKLIHEITEPLVPREIPGLKAIHAVDAAGVHPLLLAIGSERYVPYGDRVPREILTIANALLGFGQCSLAKYLVIAAGEDDPELRVEPIDSFLRHRALEHDSDLGLEPDPEEITRRDVLGIAECRPAHQRAIARAIDLALELFENREARRPDLPTHLPFARGHPLRHHARLHLVGVMQREPTISLARARDLHAIALGLIDRIGPLFELLLGRLVGRLFRCLLGCSASHSLTPLEIVSSVPSSVGHMDWHFSARIGSDCGRVIHVPFVTWAFGRVRRASANRESIHLDAAVDIERLARNVARQIRGEKHNGNSGVATEFEPTAPSISSPLSGKYERVA